MNRRRPVIMWVDPDFHNMIKVKSAEEKTSIVGFTRKWVQVERAKMQDNYSSVKENNQVKRKWNFEL